MKFKIYLCFQRVTLCYVFKLQNVDICAITSEIFFFKAMFDSDNCTREMKLMASNLKVIIGVLDTVTFVYRMEYMFQRN